MWTLLVTTLVMMALSSCDQEDGDYSIRSGILEVRIEDGQPRLVLSELTQTVVRAPQQKVLIGFAIASSRRRTFEVATVHYLPGAPATLGGEFAHLPPEAANEGLHSDPVVVDGARFFNYELGPGDPYGIYRIDVFVNGEFFRELRFEVMEAIQTPS